ncbi:desiccation-associated late embryogenesis abundant protein, partial [Deinococcus sp. 14RED07]|nr:desiccation-associated late embryogenesis abundant protein [Deinococcus sp. 14RED07]
MKSDRHFPVKRLLVLGALVGAGAYYFSREQNRRALDSKLAELGLKDAAQDVGQSVTKGWEKTKDAAKDAGAVIADKAGEVKDAAAGGAQAAADKVKE